MIDFENFYHNPKFRAVAAILFGVGLFVQGWTFYTHNWDDVLYGMIAGPLVIIIAIIFLVRTGKRNKNV